MTERSPLLFGNDLNRSSGAAGKNEQRSLVDDEVFEQKNETPKSSSNSRVQQLLASFIPVRYLLAVLIFFGCANIYALRVNLSIAMVAMVKSPGKHHPVPAAGENARLRNATTTHRDTCAPADGISSNFISFASAAAGSSDISEKVETFDWPEAVQSLLLAAFFYGYICTQILGGHLASRFGGYRVVGCGVFGISLLTIFTEPAARAGPSFLFLLRFLQGFCEGVSYPSFHTMWSRWAPVGERSRLIMVSYAGGHIGTIGAMVGTGWLSENYGWPTVFYLSGCLGLMWCLIWFWLASDDPRTHPFISQDELLLITADYIDIDDEEHQKQLVADYEDVDGQESSSFPKRVRKPVPWRLLLQSAPVYAVCLYSFGSSWCTYTYLTELPAYMHNVLRVSLTANGMLTALPYLALTVVNVAAGFSADAAIQRGASVTAVRKWFTITAHVLPAPFLLLITAAGCNFVWVEVMLVAALSASGLSQININYLDLVDIEYAGILYGMGNTVSSLGGIILPQVAGWVVGEPETQSFTSWSRYFVISVIVIVASAVVYGVLGSGDRLPWLDEYLEIDKRAQKRQPRKSIPYGLFDDVDGSALGFYQQDEQFSSGNVRNDGFDARRRRISFSDLFSNNNMHDEVNKRVRRQSHA